MDKKGIAEETLLVIKPDGVRRKLIGEVMARLEKENLEIEDMRMLRLSRERAEELYSVHGSKNFYNDLIDYVTSGPVVAIKILGVGSIETVRNLVGSTDPSKAVPGTIRGDLAESIDQNLVHASDSKESALREIKILFP
jgi:nucleoside-diphosphate kinase